MTTDKTREELLRETEDLRVRLADAEETLRAIGSGEVDAFVISGAEGDRVFTLKGAEQPYRILVETMNEGAAILSADGCILYCNNSLAAMLHISPESIVGIQFCTLVDPADELLLEARLESCTNECNREEIILRTGMGDPVPTLISCRSFDLSGSQGISVVVTDLTQQKRNEEFLAEEKLTRSIIEQAEELIFVCDERGQIIRASRLAPQLCAENPLLKPFDQVVPLRLAESGLHFSLLSFAGNKEFKNSEVVFTQSDGQKLYFLLNASHLKGKEEQNLGFVVILTDITVRRQNEEARIKLEERLQHSEKMEAIGTLAGGIAHDFNNILGAILGYAEMAREDCMPESTIGHDLDQILLAGHRAKDLVKQILAFSRQSTTEKLPLQPAPIIRETLKLLRSSLPATIDIQEDIETDMGCIVIDPTQLHQILMNLCTNAYHAMEETGGILAVSMQQKELSGQDLASFPYVLPGKFVALSVKDTGVGMSQELQGKIFDPYFTTKDIGKGTGMGLAIVHGIVKSYGGFVSCRSVLGEGTEFHVVLPICEGSDEAQNTVSVSLPVGTEHILLVDDEKILAEMAKSMLQRMGYAVTARTSSLEALTTFRNQPDAFDLVITDQTMPGMTGTDLARRMLQLRPELPIILCTGYSSQISKEKVQSYGIRGFIMKPLAKNDLALLIRSILD